jgi:ATP-dependent DNA helicase RecQ
MRQRALTYLRQALNNQAATFVTGQWEAIEAVLLGGRRALVVQKTGWGKSMVYFIATKIKREQRLGPTIVFSPLKALMRDQVAAANSLGLRAETLNSDQDDGEALRVETALRANSVDILLISPERLSNTKFRELIATTSVGSAGLVVIDEAHCVSDWGHDFRPDYRRIARLVRNLPPTTSVLATTATANERVIEDLSELLGENSRVLRGPLSRESLSLQILPQAHAAERLAWLAENIPNLPGSGIIYALTQRDTIRVSRWLEARGINAPAYHAGVGDERSNLEEALRGNQVKALVATIALGMGYDKPDLGFVIHYQSPASLVAYYQQIGRAGRAIPDAKAILMQGCEDDAILDYFAAQSPPLDEVRAVTNELRTNGPVKLRELGRRVNIAESKLKFILKVLECEEPPAVIVTNQGYALTPGGRIDEARITQVQRRKRREREEMIAFADSPDCLMEAVASALDDPTATPCGKCANCLQRNIVPSRASDEMIQLALMFLDRDLPVITPRKVWVTPLPGYAFSGRIPESLQCRPGFCLSYFGDPGIARAVAAGTARNIYPESIAAAAAAAIRQKWPVLPFTVITWVPSTRVDHPIPAFAAELGRLLGLRIVEMVQKVIVTAPQKSMRNAGRQSQNLDGAFRVIEAPNESVLLVDDVCYSKWSFTIVGALLRQAGTGEVYCFALSSAAGAAED